MILNNEEILKFPAFFPQKQSVQILKTVFDLKEIWYLRTQRAPQYKNAKFYTLGSALYLDLLKPEEWKEFCDKVEYFNSLIRQHFMSDLQSLVARLGNYTGEKFAFLNDMYPAIGLPGFHIFEPHLALTAAFNNPHRDHQWMAFTKMPGFDLPMKNHFTATYALQIPKLGPHFLYGEGLEKDYYYTEGTMYIHSGDFIHSVSPLSQPMTPLDWRITLQFHGFESNGINYIYW